MSTVEKGKLSGGLAHEGLWEAERKEDSRVWPAWSEEELRFTYWRAILEVALKMWLGQNTQ